jgi:hypothetical protein
MGVFHICTQLACVLISVSLERSRSEEKSVFELNSMAFKGERYGKAIPVTGHAGP